MFLLNTRGDTAGDRRRGRCNRIQWTYVVMDYIVLIPPAGKGGLDHTPWDILLTMRHLVFSAMRALALTSSKVFSALILILSLGPVGVNVVRVLFVSLKVLALRTHDNHTLKGPYWTWIRRSN